MKQKTTTTCVQRINLIYDTANFYIIMRPVGYYDPLTCALIKSY